MPGFLFIFGRTSWAAYVIASHILAYMSAATHIQFTIVKLLEFSLDRCFK